MKRRIYVFVTIFQRHFASFSCNFYFCCQSVTSPLQFQFLLFFVFSEDFSELFHNDLCKLRHIFCCQFKFRQKEIQIETLENFFRKPRFLIISYHFKEWNINRDFVLLFTALRWMIVLVFLATTSSRFLDLDAQFFNHAGSSRKNLLKVVITISFRRMLNDDFTDLTMSAAFVWSIVPF